jgi:hypothetical protein
MMELVSYAVYVQQICHVSHQTTQTLSKSGRNLSPLLAVEQERNPDLPIHILWLPRSNIWQLAGWCLPSSSQAIFSGGSSDWGLCAILVISNTTMNDIKQLETQVRALKAERQTLTNGINDIVAYLNSSKLACGNELDGYVQINDVLRRIADTKSNATNTALDYSNIYNFNL